MFYSLSNLSASSAVEMPEPWNFKATASPPYGDKAAMQAWSLLFGTQHAFISMYEGMTSGVRVLPGDNEPFKLHGIIVDYDGRLPPDPAEYLKKKPIGEFMPNYVVETSSGNGRLVWMFAEPIALANASQIKEFIKAVHKHMRLDKWLPGIDTKALATPGQYYEIGKAWHPVEPTARISRDIVEMWMIKASDSIQFGEEKSFNYVIPMEDIAKEIDTQFPGRLIGQFALNARCNRFWDPDGKNPTSAVVKQDGVLCFSGPTAFMSWRAIFGPAFVTKYESEYISRASKHTAYDGLLFWLEDEEGAWRSMGKEDFSQALRIQGFDSKRKPGKTYSELDKIEHEIKTKNAIAGAAPFLFFKPGKLPWRGDVYLNTSRVRPIAPVPPVTPGAMVFSDGKTYFPMIHKLLSTMFVNEESDLPDVQLLSFLAWLKYFYIGARAYRPGTGQAVVIAGPQGKGKSFLAREIVGRLMGGPGEDAEDYLMRGGRWTERVMMSPLMLLDDAMGSLDRNKIREFTNRVKQHVANPEIVYEQKYRKAISCPWFGRIMLLCNSDEESRSALPSMDMSTRDKISLFKASGTVIDFSDRETNSAKAQAELPFFARFLEDWTIPKEYMPSEQRFGVKVYHHPELLEATCEQGVGVILELVISFIAVQAAKAPQATYWEGSAMELYENISITSPAATRAVNPHWLATQLGQMAANGFHLIRRKDDRGHAVWRIFYDIGNRAEEVETKAVV